MMIISIHNKNTNIKYLTNVQYTIIIYVKVPLVIYMG